MKHICFTSYDTCLFQRLAGATLLVFANKQDLPGALPAEKIREVHVLMYHQHDENI
jgi:signal recognition particle receptor subunit beta